MSNIQVADTQSAQLAVKFNNSLSTVMAKSDSWKFFIEKLPAARREQIPNDVFSYVTLHADTVKDLDANDFMARVVDCYSQGYTLTDGDGFILPFWNSKLKRFVAAFVPGWVGIKRRAMETGLFRYFTVSHIYEGTIKGYDHRREIPIFDETKIPTGTEKVIGYLGYYEMFSGAKQEIYCSVESLQAHALKYSPQSRKAGELVGLWKDSLDAMCLKTMYRKLGKLAPKSKNPTPQQAQFYAELETDDEPQYERPANVNEDGVVVESSAIEEVDGETLPFDEPPIPDDYDYEPEPPQGYSQSQNDSCLKCADCGETIKTNVYEYSTKKYGKPLCYNCQQKHKA
ncbi:MAG: recombinase RecT [Eubacterium sp.]|nr:recombinase RecT [Eubacterium sp.]